MRLLHRIWLYKISWKSRIVERKETGGRLRDQRTQSDQVNGKKHFHTQHFVVEITEMYEPVLSANNVTATATAAVIRKQQESTSSDGQDENEVAASLCAETTDADDDQRMKNNGVAGSSPRRPPRRKKRAQDRRRLEELRKGVCNNREIKKERKEESGVTMRTGTGDRCIDIDHITLGHNNYKNKKQSVATQTCQVVPYRLKFWPKSEVRIKCAGDAKVLDHVQCCCRTLSQLLLSQVGLTIILLSWALLGAFAFYQTEGPREQEQAKELKKLQDELTIDLSTDLISSDKEGWNKIINKYALKHETLLLEAVSAGYGEGGGEGGRIWTYPGCILFAVSLLTTLGFGAPVPRTPLGRGAAILFSAVGIPLHFLLILNIGNLTAGILYNLATKEPKTEIPNISTGVTKTATWLKWLPLIAVLFYYAIGVALFGVLRSRGVVDSLMFPLDFTAAGGVAKTSGVVRIFYALYLEFAVTLAAIIVSLVQVTATRGFIDLGLKLGLLTNN
ncbi:uncharacterized protein [Onthophagus taurus]|uniref:uncharacterized protein isoform X1 n=2 Tax=Onthophagus taurus TaxID=166361 RepID=UPI000C209278|nr:uncharacterized protein LOC111414432 isoform X2 [Onthophagus taurus]